MGSLEPEALDEASGIVASRRAPNLLWTHNDSGDRARLFLIGRDGRAHGELELKGADAIDWEDIAIGQPHGAAPAEIYVGDIGDNFGLRDRVQIYHFPEPEIGADLRPAVREMVPRRLDVRYETGALDAETLLVDPLRGDLYIVQKTGRLTLKPALAAVLRIATEDIERGTAIARKVATVPFAMSTAGDVLPDGTGVALRNYAQARYFPRDPAEPLFTAFSAAPCTLPLAHDPQGEALAFAASGSGYFTVSEGKATVVRFFPFR